MSSTAPTPVTGQSDLPATVTGRPDAMDVLVAIFAGVIITALIHLDPEVSPRSPDALAYALGATAAGSLLLRRGRPMATLVMVLAIHFAYHLAGYPGAGPFPALMVSLFGLAAAGMRMVAIFAAAAAGAAAVVMQVVADGAPLLSPTIILPGVLAIASVFAGEARHNRVRYLDEVKERISRAEAEREARTERRITEERLRIARELHDIIAHTITVITVQAGEAQDALDAYPEQTREALRNIRDASREAMSELRATVGVLRNTGDTGDTGEPRKPAPGLRDLPELVQTASGGSLQVTLEIQGARRSLPAAIELTAYRIVQESLTNVIRHSGASNAAVLVRFEPEIFTIQVDDDGRGTATPAAGGHGVPGMQERAAAVGGSLEAGPRAEGGFRVWAALPVDPA